MTATPATTSALALKEWGAVVHALLDGRQTVLLRKGGIHEKAFTVADQPGGFVVFPTVAHSHAARVRPEHEDLLARGAQDVTDGHLTIRCGLTIVAAVEVAQPQRLPEIADLHIWTDDSVREDRLEFRPRHPLQALVVRAVALPEPVALPRLEAYGGCKSWIELPLAWDAHRGEQVHDEERLLADAHRLRTVLAAR